MDNDEDKKCEEGRSEKKQPWEVLTGYLVLENVAG